MNITESQVRRIMPKASSENIKAFVESFNKYSDTFGIITKLRTAAYIAQVATETGSLNYTEENLNYSADALLRVFPKYFIKETATWYARKPQAIANRVYANRMGNGDEASGDGWKFRGRAYLQITGRKNYQRYAESGYCNGDLMSHPEWLAQQPGCQKASMFFWLSNGLNRLADAGNIKGMSKAINGGYNGLETRMYFYRVACKVFGI